MKKIIILAVVIMGTMFTTSAGTITNLYNTGVNDSGNPLANGTISDPHYALIDVPSGSTREILTRTAIGGYPIPPYVADDSISAWIGPNNDSQLDGPAGHYDYHTTFTVLGMDLSATSIKGQFSSDNGFVNILLNGHSMGIFNTSDVLYYTWTSFTIGAGSPFISGENTLDFIVNNDAGPTALRVEMEESNPAQPLPPTSVPDCGLNLFWEIAILGLILFFGSLCCDTLASRKVNVTNFSDNCAGLVLSQSDASLAGQPLHSTFLSAADLLMESSAEALGQVWEYPVFRVEP